MKISYLYSPIHPLLLRYREYNDQYYDNTGKNEKLLEPLSVELLRCPTLFSFMIFIWQSETNNL
jgi:hypothetical protein